MTTLTSTYLDTTSPTQGTFGSADYSFLDNATFSGNTASGDLFNGAWNPNDWGFVTAQTPFSTGSLTDATLAFDSSVQFATGDFNLGGGLTTLENIDFSTASGVTIDPLTADSVSQDTVSQFETLSTAEIGVMDTDLDLFADWEDPFADSDPYAVFNPSLDGDLFADATSIGSEYEALTAGFVDQGVLVASSDLILAQALRTGFISFNQHIEWRAAQGQALLDRLARAGITNPQDVEYVTRALHVLEKFPNDIEGQFAGRLLHTFELSQQNYRDAFAMKARYEARLKANPNDKALEASYVEFVSNIFIPTREALVGARESLANGTKPFFRENDIQVPSHVSPSQI